MTDDDDDNDDDDDSVDESWSGTLVRLPNRVA